MPVPYDVEFHGMLQRGFRVQIPVTVRWRFKLESGELLKIRVSPLDSWRSEKFWGRLQKGGRIRVPSRVREILGLYLDRDIQPGEILEVTIIAED